MCTIMSVLVLCDQWPLLCLNFTKLVLVGAFDLRVTSLHTKIS